MKIMNFNLDTFALSIFFIAIIGIIIAVVFIKFPDVQTNNTVFKLNDNGKVTITRAYGMKLFITYCIGTSFHELIFSYVESAIRSLFNKNG